MARDQLSKQFELDVTTARMVVQAMAAGGGDPQRETTARLEVCKAAQRLVDAGRVAEAHQRLESARVGLGEQGADRWNAVLDDVFRALAVGGGADAIATAVVGRLPAADGSPSACTRLALAPEHHDALVGALLLRAAAADDLSSRAAGLWLIGAGPGPTPTVVPADLDPTRALPPGPLDLRLPVGGVASPVGALAPWWNELAAPQPSAQATSRLDGTRMSFETLTPSDQRFSADDGESANTWQPVLLVHDDGVVAVTTVAIPGDGGSIVHRPVGCRIGWELISAVELAMDFGMTRPLVGKYRRAFDERGHGDCVSYRVSIELHDGYRQHRVSIRGVDPINASTEQGIVQWAHWLMAAAAARRTATASLTDADRHGLTALTQAPPAPSDRHVEGMSKRLRRTWRAELPGWQPITAVLDAVLVDGPASASPAPVTPPVAAPTPPVAAPTPPVAAPTPPVAAEPTTPPVTNAAAGPEAWAGWHPDPARRHQLRWWDGSQWSEHVLDGEVPARDPV